MINAITWLVPTAVAVLLHFPVARFVANPWARLALPALLAVIAADVLLRQSYNAFQLGPFVDVGLAFAFFLAMGAIALLEARISRTSRP